MAMKDRQQKSSKCLLLIYTSISVLVIIAVTQFGENRKLQKKDNLLKNDLVNTKKHLQEGIDTCQSQVQLGARMVKERNEQWPDFGCEGIKVQRAHQPTSQCQEYLCQLCPDYAQSYTLVIIVCHQFFTYFQNN
eukprot:TRINITY_DN6721_c0_g1_i6.p4 TRINITY_DN6721_c0_g1~~TRINITY_DN6721_c0_g1_i6.p4  ORF type:complete len:134 (-),score=9.64 TRINITY_DN6721_c0_g1_i6:642-1043(-)